jgi:GntR family transcriptional regulator, histidine utilization repressor
MGRATGQHGARVAELLDRMAQPRLQSAVLNIPDIRTMVEARDEQYGYRTLLDERRPPCCVHLGAEGHHLGESRFIRSLHLADDSPVLIEERHIFLDAVPAAAEADFAMVPAGVLAAGPRPLDRGGAPDRSISRRCADGARVGG